MQELTAYAKEKIKEFPQLEEDIIDLVMLARDEIEDGGSEDHECEFAYGSIDELLSEV